MTTVQPKTAGTGAHLVLALIVLATLSVLVLGWSLRQRMILPIIENYTMPSSFDQKLWLASERTGLWPMRLRMVDDLVATRLLIGRSREQVLALIGPPDKTFYFHDYDMVYLLGPERGLIRIDSEWLVLKLAKDDRCEPTGIVHD